MDNEVNDRNGIISEMPDFKKQKDIRNISQRLVVLFIGFGLCFSSTSSVVLLQSSMNIDRSLGTISLTLSHISGMLSSIFVVPSLLRRFGCRFCVVIGEMSITGFILANIYPEFYTLIPAAIIQGLGAASFWISLTIIYVYLGKMHGVYGTQSAKTYVRRYTGMFFVVLQFSKICGNVISWLILYFTGPEGSEKADSSFANNFTVGEGAVTLSTAHIEAEAKFFYCGANDCQDPNVTRKNIERYVPSDTSRYVLMSVFTGLCVVSILFHYCLLPKIKPAGESNLHSDKLHKLLKIPTANDSKGDVLKTSPTETKTIKENLKDTLKHLISCQQLLVTPILVYQGMFLGYVTGDMTRSYSSCILGVEQVGLCVVTYCFMSLLLSLTYGRIAEKFGRNILFPLFAFMEIGIYLFCLLWRPHPGLVWMTYLAFGIFGVVDGFRKNFLIDFCTDYFSAKLELGMTAWSMWITIGMGIQFSLGSLLCVRTKICILIVFCILSLISYAIAEIRFQKGKLILLKEDEENEEENPADPKSHHGG